MTTAASLHRLTTAAASAFAVAFLFAALIALAATLGGCTPNYAGAGYVALALVLDRQHAAAQEQSRQVAREIEGDE